MELDELKNTWTVLDEQLKKNETLNKQILQEMVHKRSNKSLSKLTNTEFIGIIIALVFIPFLIWLYGTFLFESMLSVKVFTIACTVYIVLSLIWSWYKLKKIMKIDFSKNVKDSFFCINKYNIMIKQEKIAISIFAPILALSGAFCYYEFNVGISLWTFLVVWITILTVISFWIYKKIYDPHIQSIKKGLEELKELTEE